MDSSKTYRPRTLVLDTARLYKQNKISREDLIKMEKNFRDEVLECARTMEDEETPLINIEFKSKSVKVDLMKGYVPARPKPTSPPPRPEPKPEAPKVTPPPKPVPPSPSPVPSQPKIEVVSAPVGEEASLHRKLDELTNKKKAVIETYKGLELQRQSLLKELETVRTKEKEIEVEEQSILAQEKNSPTAEQKTLEEKRWKLEDSRQQCEKDRWSYHQKIETFDTQISQKHNEQATIEGEEKKLNRELENLRLKKEADKAREDKAVEEKVYAAIEIKKRTYEIDWIRLKEEVKVLNEKISKTDNEALAIKNQIEEINQKEKNAAIENERHSFEEKRWELEKKLRDIETVVWDIDAEIKKKTVSIAEIEKTFVSIQLDEETSKEKIHGYTLAIKKAE